MSSPEPARTVEHDLRAVFGLRLQSLVRYRPGATPVRLMAIVDTVTADDLRALASHTDAWHDAGFATPLVMGRAEFEHSLDAFPLEFGAIIAHHEVVAGVDPFETLTVDAADVRRACEVQARSHLLHLRQGFLETKGNLGALSVLIVESAPAFAALLSSVERLEGRAPIDGVAKDIVALQHVKEITSAEAERLFAPYLDAVQRLVQYVDGWGDR